MFFSHKCIKYTSLVKKSDVFTIQETRCFSSSVVFFLHDFIQHLVYDQMFPFAFIFILHFLNSVFSSVINYLKYLTIYLLVSCK